MAISIVQGPIYTPWTQTSTNVLISVTGVTPGNFGVVCINFFDSSGSTTTFGCSDGQGAYTADFFANYSGLQVATFSLANLNSGTHNLNVTTTSLAANTHGQAAFYELSGGVTAVDQFVSASNNSTGPVASGSTAPLNAANEILFALAVTANTVATIPPTGGPGTYTQDINRTDAGIFYLAHQIQTTGTSAVSNTYGTQTSGKWIDATVTYQSPAIIGNTLLGQICT